MSVHVPGLMCRPTHKTNDWSLVSVFSFARDTNSMFPEWNICFAHPPLLPPALCELSCTLYYVSCCERVQRTWLCLPWSQLWARCLPGSKGHWTSSSIFTLLYCYSYKGWILQLITVAFLNPWTIGEQLYWETTKKLLKYAPFQVKVEAVKVERQRGRQLKLKDKEVAASRGGIMSAAKPYQGKKGQTCRRCYDWVIVNVYMPGVSGVTDCHPSVLSKASAQ